MQSQILVVIIMLIAAAVFVVAIFKKLNLSPVLGYLVAGAMIGDHGMKIVAYEQTTLLAELGVVFLLFAIGLELSIERLKAMRRYVFGLGSLQVFITVLTKFLPLINIDMESIKYGCYDAANWMLKKILDLFLLL